MSKETTIDMSFFLNSYPKNRRKKTLFTETAKKPFIKPLAIFASF